MKHIGVMAVHYGLWTATPTDPATLEILRALLVGHPHADLRVIE